MIKHLATLAILCAFGSVSGFGKDAFPVVSGETLAGKPVVLPDAIKGKQTILIVSFSRAAETQTRGWSDRLANPKSGTASVKATAWFQVLELEDVPRLFRGFVKSSIGRGIPRKRYDSFILLFEGQDALKKLTGFRHAGDAYVLLLDANGNVQWRESGTVNEPKIDSLKKELSK